MGERCMLRVFIGSTFRDLEKERETLLNELETALVGVGMEKFVPDGKTSQEIGVEELRDSDLVIFLISPYYGSFIKECKIEDCRAECPMKNHEHEISYTHCEYKVALAENKPHQAYLIDENWDVVDQLKDWDNLDWREIWENPVFKELGRKRIEHYFGVARKVLEFREEASLEFCPPIKDVRLVTAHLAKNIVMWYSEGMINLDDFCGRRKDLKDLFEKMSENVEVYGVGGIGKTTLIHVALLIQKLMGKKIVSVGTKQSYLTGSGYRYFREKCREDQHEILGITITLDDILDALSLPHETKLKNKKEKLNLIMDKIENANIILFIDDFHLADRDVRDLVRNARGVVTASRRRIGVARNELPLYGIERKDREEFIELVTKRLRKEISDDAKEKIKNIAEGHPVSTEILVRNYEKINFQELEDFKYGLDLSNPKHVEEFLKRVVQEVLSEEATSLLEVLSLINTDLENNLDKATIEQTYAIRNFDEIFAEVIDAGILEKKRGKEGTYQFSYNHIQGAIREERSKENHERAIEYYRNKIENLGESYEDIIEILFHRVKSNPDESSVGAFVEIVGKTKPSFRGFKRLIDIGEELRDRLNSEHKARTSATLGHLYRSLRRFGDAEKACKKALVIYERLAKKEPETYLPDVAGTQNNLGNLYSILSRYEDAEKAYKKALAIYKQLATKNKEFHLEDILQTQANIGHLYIETNKDKEGIRYLGKVLRRRDVLPDFGARCFGHLGKAYEKLRNPKNAAENHFFASANYFLLFRKGVHCLDRVLYHLEKAIELGDSEIEGDARLIRTVIYRLAGREENIPQVPLSKRGAALKEALRGRKVEFQPENDIESMILILIKDILAKE